MPSQREQEWDFNEVEEEFEITSKAAPPKRPRRKNLPKFRDPARVRPIIKYNDCSQVCNMYSGTLNSADFGTKNLRTIQIRTIPVYFQVPGAVKIWATDKIRINGTVTK